MSDVGGRVAIPFNSTFNPSDLCPNVCNAHASVNWLFLLFAVVLFCVYGVLHKLHQEEFHRTLNRRLQEQRVRPPTVGTTEDEDWWSYIEELNSHNTHVNRLRYRQGNPQRSPRLAHFRLERQLLQIATATHGQVSPAVTPSQPHRQPTPPPAYDAPPPYSTVIVNLHRDVRRGYPLETEVSEEIPHGV
jgi:hypothetical protein